MLTSGTQMIIDQFDHRMVIYLDQIHSAISNISAFQAFSSTAVINRKETGPWLVAAQLMQCCRNGAGPCNGWEEGGSGCCCVTMLLLALLEGVRDIVWVIIVKLREREGQGVDPGRSPKGHLWMEDGGWWISFP